MKERPILFSAPMVRAILDGRKTVTRRACKFTNTTRLKEPGGRWHRQWCPDDPNAFLACPYGQPGDRLWVRETWRLWESASFASFTGEPLDPDIVAGSLKRHDIEWLESRPVEYRADSLDEGPWRPSIFMPRWASRITLEVTEIRVERLHDITEEEARAEGVLLTGGRAGLEPHHFRPARDLFAELWTHINGPESWDANPWVWVVRWRHNK